MTSNPSSFISADSCGQPNRRLGSNSITVTDKEPDDLFKTRPFETAAPPKQQKQTLLLQSRPRLAGLRLARLRLSGFLCPIDELFDTLDDYLDNNRQRLYYLIVAAIQSHFDRYQHVLSAMQHVRLYKVVRRRGTAIGKVVFKPQTLSSKVVKCENYFDALLESTYDSGHCPTVLNGNNGSWTNTDDVKKSEIAVAGGGKRSRSVTPKGSPREVGDAVAHREDPSKRRKQGSNVDGILAKLMKQVPNVNHDINYALGQLQAVGLSAMNAMGSAIKAKTIVTVPPQDQLRPPGLEEVKEEVVEPVALLPVPTMHVTIPVHSSHHQASTLYRAQSMLATYVNAMYLFNVNFGIPAALTISKIAVDLGHRVACVSFDFSCYVATYLRRLLLPNNGCMRWVYGRTVQPLINRIYPPTEAQMFFDALPFDDDKEDVYDRIMNIYNGFAVEAGLPTARDVIRIVTRELPNAVLDAISSVVRIEQRRTAQASAPFPAADPRVHGEVIGVVEGYDVRTRPDSDMVQMGYTHTVRGVIYPEVFDQLTDEMYSGTLRIDRHFAAMMEKNAYMIYNAKYSTGYEPKSDLHTAFMTDTICAAVYKLKQRRHRIDQRTGVSSPGGTVDYR